VAVVQVHQAVLEMVHRGKVQFYWLLHQAHLQVILLLQAVVALEMLFTIQMV